MSDFFMTFLICWLSGLAFLIWVIRRQTVDANKRVPPPPPPSPPSAEEILKQRFVRGEINLQQYDWYLGVLHRTPVQAGHNHPASLTDPYRR